MNDLDGDTTISKFELNRIRQCEEAWYAIYNLIVELKGPECLLRPGMVGRECVLATIREMHKESKK